MRKFLKNQDNKTFGQVFSKMGFLEFSKQQVPGSHFLRVPLIASLPQKLSITPSLLLISK